MGSGNAKPKHDVLPARSGRRVRKEVPDRPGLESPKSPETKLAQDTNVSDSCDSGSLPELESSKEMSQRSVEEIMEEPPEDNLFRWGDAAIDIEEAITRPPQKKKNPRMGKMGNKPKKKPGGRGAAPDPVFSFGDFNVLVDDGDFIDKMEEDEVKKPLDEYMIHSYTQRWLIGHPTRVKAICVAPGEKSYVSCSNEESSLTMSDMRTGKELLTFMGHEDTIISAACSADNKFIATASRDHSMILWDIATGKQVLSFEHEKVVICCCFSRDGKMLVSGCQDKVCRVWDTRRGREIATLSEHEGIIISVSFSPDGKKMVSSSADKTLKVWDIETTRCEHTLVGHMGIVLACAYRSDGTKIASNDEQHLMLWDAETGVALASLSAEDVERPFVTPGKRMAWTLSCYAPGKLGAYVVAASNSRSVHVLKLETHTEVLTLVCPASVYCLSAGDHSIFAFGDAYGNICTCSLRAM
eukprot:Hpha_TRINITY_DN11709_c0_g1::TRINITY_DN11709_c0_g1_i1::g.31802::m.31802